MGGEGCWRCRGGRRLLGSGCVVKRRRGDHLAINQSWKSLHRGGLPDAAGRVRLAPGTVGSSSRSEVSTHLLCFRLAPHELNQAISMPGDRRASRLARPIPKLSCQQFVLTQVCVLIISPTLTCKQYHFFLPAEDTVCCISLPLFFLV